MSWVSRWGIKNMRRWGGWHSLEEREEYLLGNIKHLEKKIKLLEIKDKLLDDRLDMVYERTIESVRDFFRENILVQRIEDDVYITNHKRKKEK